MTIDHSAEIITQHVGAAMVAAAVPVPLADIAAVTAVQVSLVRRLAQRYGVEYDVLRGRAAVFALAGASIARVGASAVKALPGGGWLLGGATQIALSGASTYALGEAYREHFESRGSLDDVDVDSLRARYRDAVERGREIARTLRRTMEDDTAEVDEETATRERLERLRRAGILTPEEYERLVEPRTAVD